MKKYLIFILFLLAATKPIYSANLSEQDKSLLNYGRQEGLVFESNSKYIDYYRINESDSSYTSYFENGRRYYVNEYTYRDNNDRKHYIRIKYYLGIDNERIYSIEDYYYNSYGDRIYIRDETNLRRYSISDSVFSQESFKTRTLDGKKYYLYEDTYRRNDVKHYVIIEYYYKDSEKIYTLKSYYYNKDGDRIYTVNVDEKKLTDSDLKYYLEYYLKSDEYKDRNYYDNVSRYDEYYYDTKGRRIYYSDTNRVYYDDFKYTTSQDYLKKVNQLSDVRPTYSNGKKYFGDDTIYEYEYEYNKDYIKYNSIADLLPSKMPPDEKNWPKKSNLTSKKKDLINELSKQVEFERSYMGRGYFNQNVIDGLLKRYFPEAYEDASNSTGRLEAFLYYFGFADAFFDKYNDIGNVRGFLYNYGEPLFSLLRNFNSGYYTSAEINEMMNSSEKKETVNQINTLIKKKTTKSELEEKEYFEDKNKKIKQER